jgi:hypothetical protein
MLSLRQPVEARRGLLLELLEDRIVPSIPAGTILVCTAPSPFSIEDQSSFPIGIVGVDPSTGAQFPISTGGLFSLPTYICEAPNGQLYITDLTAVDPATGKQTGAVIQVDPNTGNQSLLASGGYIDGPNGVTFQNGYLYAANEANSSGVIHDIVEIDPATGRQRLVTSGEEYSSGESRALQRLVANSGGFSVPVGIAPAPGNNVYVADEPGNVQGSDPGKVWRIDLDTGQQTLLSSNNDTQGVLFDHPSDIAVDANGNLFVGNTGSASNYYSGSVFRVDPETGIQTSIAAFGSATGLDSVTLDQNSGTMFVGAISSGTTAGMIYAVDPTTGAQSIVASGNLMSLVEGIMVYRAVEPVSPAALGPGGLRVSQDRVSLPDETSVSVGASVPCASPLEPAAVAALFAATSESRGVSTVDDAPLWQMLDPADEFAALQKEF